jgi:hypothetical protein
MLYDVLLAHLTGTKKRLRQLDETDSQYSQSEIAKLSERNTEIKNLWYYFNI